MIFNYFKTLAKLFLGRGVRKSYSQFGEDAFLRSVFVDKVGTYCDVGAYHPVLYSNTYAFYKAGWRGLMIDPNTSFVSLYKILRPRDKFIDIAVGTGADASTYYMFSDPAYNTLSPKEAEKTKSLHHTSFLLSRPVLVKPLSEILKENNINKLDFLNIDVEGRGLEVLQSHDWSIRPNIIAIEDHDFNPDEPPKSSIYNFMRSKRYLLKGLCGPTLIWKSE